MNRRATSVVLLALAAAAAGGAAWPTAKDALIERYRAVCTSLAAKAERAEQVAIKGEDGWLFLAADLRHAGVGKFWGDEAKEVSRAGKGDHADPVPAIVSFNDQLRALGIELLLVPVPPKAVVYADKVPDSPVRPDPNGRVPRVDPHHQAFYKLLGEKGVRVLDPAPWLLAARADDDRQPPYCKTDTHYSPAACEIIARHLAETIRKREWYADAPKSKVRTKADRRKIVGDLARAVDKDDPPTETLVMRFVELEGTDVDGRQSPVLLLGDSHTLVFHLGGDLHAEGAGLVAQLAAELKMPVDLLGVRGSGATPARVNLYRRSSRDPDYLDGKKLVIWCLTAREFTEALAGWRVLPVAKGSGGS